MVLTFCKFRVTLWLMMFRIVADSHIEHRTLLEILMQATVFRSTDLTRSDSAYSPSPKW